MTMMTLQSEFSALLKLVNPESNLSEASLALITQQVWHEYHSYTCEEGLDEAGFVEIYLTGGADVRRDVEYVRRAVEIERRGAGGLDRCLSFVVHASGNRARGVDSSALTKAAIVRALEDALPDCMKKEVIVDEGVETHPNARAFGVSCFFRAEDVGKDEFEYVKGMLELEPKMIFPESVFEEVLIGVFREEMIPSDVAEDVQGARDKISEYRRVSVGVMRAAELMGVVGQSTMAFAVLDEPGDGGAGLMEMLEGVLPKGAAAVVCDGGGAATKSSIVTIAVRVPTGRVRAAKESIHKVVRRSSAMEDFRERRPVLALSFTLHEYWSSEVRSFVEDVASMLPAGSRVGLGSEYPGAPQSVDGHNASDNLIRVLLTLPMDSMQREVEMFKEHVMSRTNLKSWCRAAEDVLQVEVSDGALALGLPVHKAVNLGRSSGGSFGVREAQVATFREGSTVIPDHVGPLSLVDSDDEDAAMSPVVAGYERRSPSESGSSGLVEALERTRITANVENLGTQEDAMSKKGSDNPRRSVISVNAYMPGPALAETPERMLKVKTAGGGWRGFLRSISPRKKTRNTVVDSGRNLGDEKEPDVEDGGRREVADKNVIEPPRSSNADARSADVSKVDEESREQAVMKANIAQIVGQVEYAMSSTAASNGTVNARTATLESALHAALLLPSWACGMACMRSAEILLRAGLFEEAQPFLIAATQAMPEDPLAYFRLGYTFFGLNDFDSAARHFYEAIKRCTQHDSELLVKIHINMGIALESLGNLTTAEREYNKAALIDEDHPRVHKLLGSVRYALGNYEGAASALERALKNVPDFADAWTDLGCVRRAVENKRDAVRCFKMALASEPDNLEAHYNMGVLMRETSKPKESICHYDRVLEQDPEHVMALLGKAVALSMLAEGTNAKSKDRVAANSHRKEAAVCLRRFLELCDPEDPLAIEVRRLYDMIRTDVPSKQISNQLSMLIEDVEASQRMALTPKGGVGTVRSPVKSPVRIPVHSESQSQSQSQPSRDMNKQHQVETRLGRATSEEMDSKLGNITVALPDNSAENDKTEVKHVLRRSQSQVSQSSRSQSQSQSRSMSRTASMAMEKHPTDRSYDRLCRWHPPTRVREEDFAEEVSDTMDLLLARDGSVQHVISKLDVPLLQTLHPLTTLTFDALMTATFGARSNQASPTKRYRNKTIREIHFHDFLEMILHLVRSRAPEHLVRGALMTLEHRILPILDTKGTQHVNFPVVMAMLAMLVDAPGRDRLAHAYRLLMARTTNSAAGESLATKSDVAELMASLMAAFGIEHNRKVLEHAASASVRNSAVIMTEKFEDDMEKYWPEYQVLPLLANPLR